MNSKPALPKVLCVDDEPSLLRALRWLLRGEFDVVVASDPVQALMLLRADDFDVVLSDQRMPGMTGAEFLQRAKEVSPCTVRLLLTGYADFSAVVSALNEGDVFRYLSKPWDNHKLLRSVQDAARLSRMTRLIWSDFQDTVAEDPQPHQAQEEVLLVQADAQLARACSEACADTARLLHAQDTADALTLLSQRPVAVVVLQQVQGAGDSAALVRAIKRRKPRLSVVLASASHDIHSLQALINEGLIYRYLTLPADGDHLNVVIQGAIERHLDLRQKPRRLLPLRSKAGTEAPAGPAAQPAPAASPTPGTAPTWTRWLSRWRSGSR